MRAALFHLALLHLHSEPCVAVNPALWSTFLNFSLAGTRTAVIDLPSLLIDLHRAAVGGLFTECGCFIFSLLPQSKAAHYRSASAMHYPDCDGDGDILKGDTGVQGSSRERDKKEKEKRRNTVLGNIKMKQRPKKHPTAV